ncbi:hypothetical protein V2J09_008516 [Rumex salicifolius]
MGEAVALVFLLLCFLLWKLVYNCYLKPLQIYHSLKSHGFSGPIPRFPFGNRGEMMSDASGTDDDRDDDANVDSGSMADPEFLKQISAAVATKNWGKPLVFKGDRQTMFGQFGLNMIEGEGWVLHKRIIGPALSSSYVKLTVNSMVECTKKLVDQWTKLIAISSQTEIDIEKEISSTAADIIAKTGFNFSYEEGKRIYNKLRALQFVLYKNMYNRYIGVPFGQVLSPKETLEAIRLGNEIDNILQSVINSRRNVVGEELPHDLLGLMLQGIRDDQQKSLKGMTDREVIDECKAFFVGGYEPGTLMISWTLLLLSMNRKWQEKLRQEIKEVVGDGEIDLTTLAHLKKMGLVMNEVVRLYPSSLSGVRRAKGDIKLRETIIPKGTNIWVDILGMHHDRDLWGDDVHEFKPERFRDDPSRGGCRHSMGYIPFGFGGRMCAGKNYATMLYKIVLCSLLSRFSFSISPTYQHSPVYSFTLRPSNGIHLIVKPLQG